MRFESLTIEKYGLIESRRLAFSEPAGLVLVYGPNEAGKSTSLEAISDFLFGIPDRTGRANFGYDAIRLSATLALADGTQLQLKRRKGRGRTLTDESGQPVDEGVLARALGSTGRERFGALFGLDHMTLRTGGEHLLAAEGDIGRLIVEAGGGLAGLTDLIDDLGTQASRLFDTRRKGDRAFYVALDAFDAAEEAVRKGLMTREAFEQARSRREAAEKTLDELRSRQRTLDQELSKLKRLARVVPSIREHDRLDDELADFADLPPVQPGFADACSTAFKMREIAEAASREAEERVTVLQTKLSVLALPTAILDAEAAIHDAAQQAIHVAKAREDRPNREIELAQQRDKLKAVQDSVGITDDVALEAVAPPAEVIAAVQRLAGDGRTRRARLAALDEEHAREGRAEQAIVARQETRRAAGAHEPFGLSPADFADLAVSVRTVDTKERQAASARAEIDAATMRLGFADIAEIVAWPCPEASVIQVEIDRRSAIATEQSRVLDRVAKETERHDQAAAEIERLVSGAEPPSESAIARLRAERGAIWEEIRARYLDPDGDSVAARPVAERTADVALMEDRSRQADDLADRRSAEAGRLAALERAEREKAEAAVALKAVDAQKSALAERLAAAEAEWVAAWSDAANRAPSLGMLKTLAADRGALLAQHAAWRVKAEEAETQRAALEPRFAALQEAERRLGLPVAESLAARVATANAAIRKHDDAYADWRQDETALGAVRLRLRGIEEARRALISDEAAWSAQWRPAVAGLGLDAAVSPERANEIATQWATAIGSLRGIQITRRRLERMEEDEAGLRTAIAGIAGRIDFALPEDAVAAADMLSVRLADAQTTKAQHETLTQHLAERIAERDQKRKAARQAGDDIDRLSGEARCTPDALPVVAERCRQRTILSGRVSSLAGQVHALGDGLSLEELRREWGARDLDVVRADMEATEGEQIRLIDETEAARAALHDCKQALDRLSAAEGINEAVAERERATAEIHDVLERYVETVLAEELLRAAMDRVREQRKDPLIARAGELFAQATVGAFRGIETEIDGKGSPVVVGRRASGGLVPVAVMSDGVRDQLFLSFRIASIEQYCRAAEPLPFIADDLLVHFDDDRGASALRLLAELGKTTQVLVFTHHRHLLDAAAPLVAAGRAATIELGAQDGSSARS